MPELTPIPQPPPHLWGLLGNIPELQESPIRPDTFERLTKIYGPIFKLVIPTKDDIIIISSQELVDEVSNEDRFEKFVSGVLDELQPFLNDGLFTAQPSAPNWHLAHKLLMPVFGPLSIRKMFPQMQDIVSQLILKWDRMGSEHDIDVSDDFTRLAFDTIGLCAFNYRFNDFYSQDMHPFATWMADTLIEAGNRAARTSFETKARAWSAEKYRADIQKMHKLCDDVVAERKRNPQPDVHDLLNTMLSARDDETGAGLSDESIRYNMATFLVAGHETTSGTLTFCLYCLLKYPERLHKAQAEVDEVVGDGNLTLEHIPKLKYINACLQETLRLHSPISFTSIHAKTSTTIGGKYAIEPNQQMLFNLRMLHRDPKVWGDDAMEFLPERMLNGGYEHLPPNSWKPFGNGMRACIGRAFAWQEMMMTLTLILQRFSLEMSDPAYDLKLKSTLTIKPAGFHMKVRRRPGKGDWVGLFGDSAPKHGTEHHTKQMNGGKKKDELPKLTVCYGSNAGTCKALAEDLSSNGVSNGFKVTIRTLDSAAEHIPTDHPVVIITPSYEGQPPDNGKIFVSWLESRNTDSSLLKDVKHTVFGVGNSDWTSTFHRVPKLIQSRMGDMGATQFHEPGFADVKEDMASAWESWTVAMWDSLRSISGGVQVEKKMLSVEIKPPKHSKTLGGQNICTGVVRKNVELVGPELGMAKRHMELEMAEGTEYQAGDYLVVLPLNETAQVLRVIRRFDLVPDDSMQVCGTSKSYLPIEAPESVFDFFATSVELASPITPNQLKILGAATSNSSHRSTIESFAEKPQYQKEILEKRKSVIDILEEFPTCALTLAGYIDMLKPLSPREYSISSSPLAVHNAKGLPNIVSITYDVYDAPALSGHDQRFHGVASTYLAKQPVGGHVRCLVRRTNINFHLPTDSTKPIIMIAAGTGLAPMHGFLQERAALHDLAGKELGPAILYFGCRDEEKDFIYKDELYAWQDKGIVEIRPTFSRAPVEKGAEANMHKYVSDRIWAEREEVKDLFRRGAKIFLCGSAAKVGKSVKDVCVRIYREVEGCGEEEGREWLRVQSEERFVSDLFS